MRGKRDEEWEARRMDEVGMMRLIRLSYWSACAAFYVCCHSEGLPRCSSFQAAYSLSFLPLLLVRAFRVCLGSFQTSWAAVVSFYGLSLDIMTCIKARAVLLGFRGGDEVYYLIVSGVCWKKWTSG